MLVAIEAEKRKDREKFSLKAAEIKSDDVPVDLERKSERTSERACVEIVH